MTNVSRDFVFPVVVAYFRMTLDSMKLYEIQIIKGPIWDFFAEKPEKQNSFFSISFRVTNLENRYSLYHYGAPFQYVFSDIRK